MLALDSDFVVHHRAVAAANRADIAYLEALRSQAFHRAAQQFVNSLFELLAALLFAGAAAERPAIHAKSLRSRGGIIAFESYAGRGAVRILRLVVEPPTRRDQNKQHDENNHEIVGPTAAFVGP